MNNRQKYIIVAVVTVLALGWGVYSYFSKPALVCWPYCPGMTDQDREKIDKSAQEAEIAEWKTYPGYGFSFKYPEEMGTPTVTQRSTSVEISFKNSVAFIAGIRYDQTLGKVLSFDEVIDRELKNPAYYEVSKKNITVGGRDGVKINYGDKVTGGGGTIVYVPLDAKGSILEVYDYGRAVGNVGGASVEQILPTIKFTDNQVVPSGWKTYKNEKYGFEIQHPSNFKETIDLDIPDTFSLYLGYDDTPYVGDLSIVVFKNKKNETTKRYFERKKIQDEAAYASRCQTCAASDIDAEIDDCLAHRADTVKVGGEDASVCNDMPKKATGLIRPMYVFHDGYVYELRGFNEDLKNYNEYNKILSTFKFEKVVSDWKTYRNDKYGFEFKYPSLLSLKQERGAVDITHAVVYKHPDPCDFKGDAPPKEKIFDFNVSFILYEKSLRDAVQINSGDYIVQNYIENNTFKGAYAQKFSIGSLSGFQTDSGIEGCGVSTYYFPVSSSRTLVVRRPYITELTNAIGDEQTYLNLPGVILPAQEKELFTEILSTFKFTE